METNTQELCMQSDSQPLDLPQLSTYPTGDPPWTFLPLQRFSPEPPEQVSNEIAIVVPQSIQSDSLPIDTTQEHEVIKEMQEEQEENMDMDWSEYFKTDQVFSSRNEFIDWVKKKGIEHKMVLVTGYSDFSAGRRPRLTLGCECGGTYQKRVDENGVKKRRKSVTKKTNCPFSIKGVFVPGSVDSWRGEVTCGKHNHSLVAYIGGHSCLRRLTTEERKAFEDMTKRGVRPKDALAIMKERNPGNASTLQTLYNELKKMRRSEKESRASMQELTKLIHGHGYEVSKRWNEEMDVIHNLFWAHPDSITLAKSFPYIFIVNPTYKTIMYKWSLFEIVGVTSTMKTFSCCYCLVMIEDFDNFRWALDQFRLLLGVKITPVTVVTYRDQALMEALDFVFPHVNKLLCGWHISMDVQSHGKFEISPVNEEGDEDTDEISPKSVPNMVKENVSVKIDEEMKKKNEELRQKWNDMWVNLVDSVFPSDFVSRLLSLRAVYGSDHPELIRYVEDTWLPLKEKFVAAWTNKVLHFGYTSTNRAENAHSALKNYLLKSSQYTFLDIFNMIHTSIAIQIAEIRISFQKSMNIFSHEHMLPLLDNLRGYVSTDALTLLSEENQRRRYVFSDAELCGCTLRATHGLPCAHEMNMLSDENKKLSLDRVHSFWKNLSTVQGPLEVDDLLCREEFTVFLAHWKRCDEHKQKHLLQCLKDLGSPQTTLSSRLAESLKAPKWQQVGSSNKKSKNKSESEDLSKKKDLSAIEFTIETHESSSSADLVRESEDQS